MFHTLAIVPVQPQILRHALVCAADEALEGVGIEGPTTEWRDFYEDSRAYHIRRRLTPEEEKVTGPARDVRGRQEGLNRAHAVFLANPHIIRVPACVSEMREVGYPVDRYLKGN